MNRDTDWELERACVTGRLGLELLAVTQAHRALQPHGAKLAGVLHGAGADQLRAEHAQGDHGSSYEANDLRKARLAVAISPI